MSEIVSEDSQEILSEDEEEGASSEQHVHDQTQVCVVTAEEGALCLSVRVRGEPGNEASILAGVFLTCCA